MGRSPPPNLAQSLSALARNLQHEASPQATLDAIVVAAVETVPGAEHAAVTMVHDRRELFTVSATSELSREIDRRQYASGEGPCLDALWDSRVILMDDQQAERRWPTFTREIRGLGIRSMCCFQLFARHNSLGALNLYAADPGSFGTDSADVGQLFASHASVALADAQKVEQLEQALDTRDVIGQAKGMLMERYRMNADQAFELLVKVSQRSHMKLRDVAEQVTETGRATEVHVPESRPAPAG